MVRSKNYWPYSNGVSVPFYLLLSNYRLPFPEAPDLTLYSYVIKDAISVTLVSLVITISMGKLFAKKHNYSIDVRQVEKSHFILHFE